MKVKIASSISARLCGLLGREDFEGALLLAPCNDIHTFGMKLPIDVAFLSSDGIVIAAFRNIGPRRRLRRRKAAAVIERLSSSDAWFVEGDVLKVESCDGEVAAAKRGPL